MRRALAFLGVVMTVLTTTSANGSECTRTVDEKGENHGEVRCYNEKKILTNLQTWKHGKWNGPWKYYTEEGRLYKEENYLDQRQHGRFRLWDSTTGFPKEEGQYAFGQKVGEWRNYFDSAPGGRLYYVTIYSEISKPDEAAVEIGDRMYSPDGRLTQSTKRDPIAETVLAEYFHDNGKLRERSETNQKNQTFERRTWDENGKLVRVERMKENSSHGLQEYIGENGHREVECYQMGQRQDSLKACGGPVKVAADGSEWIRRTWEDGKPREEFRLVDGERDGEYKSFDRQGKVTGTVVYKKGKAVSGKSVEYHESGTIAAEREFKDGQVTAERSYYQNGKVREESTRNGDRWKLKTFYDTGKLEREVAYVNTGNGYWSSRSYEGLEKVWDLDGQLSEEANYQFGQRDGVTKRYQNGKLYAKSTYQKGNLLSESYYDDQGRLISSTEYHSDGSAK